MTHLTKRVKALRLTVFRCVCALGVMVSGSASIRANSDNVAIVLFERYCRDCHADGSSEGGFKLDVIFKNDGVGLELPFENLATHQMPPADAEKPTDSELRVMLSYLATLEEQEERSNNRRVSRREWMATLNDLIGVNLDLADRVPDDRGTHQYDTDVRIQLNQQVLGEYFGLVDEVLESAFPMNGFPIEQQWRTSRLRNSHFTYSRHYSETDEGILFSWTRANNGNAYSYFYDGFEPSEAGWYQLRFDAKKVGDFTGDVAVQVYAGRYYYADDRPQPQRLIGVISVGSQELTAYELSAFLYPGESVSVHCYHEHNWRQDPVKEGALIRQFSARGPILDQWPPSTYSLMFDDLLLKAPPRGFLDSAEHQSEIRKIGGNVTVSSSQVGMGKELLLDGSTKTFWHTQFEPILAPPPHFVVIENPREAEILGLTYSTWTGGNGNGLVKKYSVLVSNDQLNWETIVKDGDLETSLVNEQRIEFPHPVRQRYIKFLIIDSKTLDGRSLASIGRLDLLRPHLPDSMRFKVEVSGDRSQLAKVIREFAKRAIGQDVGDEQLEHYLRLALGAFDSSGDFVEATKVGVKAIVCSPQVMFLASERDAMTRDIARRLALAIWLSIPDQQLISVFQTQQGSVEWEQMIIQEVDRMLRDPKSDRMIQSFTDQWLNLRDWEKVSPSLKLYPKYDDLLHMSLPTELRTYLAHLIREDQPVTHLVDSDYTFINQRIASHYGIDDVVGHAFRRVELSGNEQRGGLLTMGAVMKITTDGFQTSPILRGAWISKNLVGNPLSPPPANVSTLEPIHDQNLASLREQIERHQSNIACSGCHRRIDPYGFALESFDAVGQWRGNYWSELPHPGTFIYRINGYHQKAGVVETAHELNGERFKNIVELKKLLVRNHPQIAYNFAKQFFHYVNGCSPNLDQRMALLDYIHGSDKPVGMKKLVCQVFVISMELSRGE